MSRGSRRSSALRVAILGHERRPGVSRAAGRLRTLLRRRGCEVRVESRLAEQLGIEGAPLEELGSWCAVLVTLGGDGTMLIGARALAGHRGALLPINLGGLGFLTAAELPEMEAAVRAVLKDEWRTVGRPLLAARVNRRGRVAARGIAVNDAVVRGADGYSAVHLQLQCLGQDLGRLVADGLIAATAPGSTAYSLSAGGPVLAPDVEAVVVTPVAAHTVGSRPLVLSPRSSISLRVLGPRTRALLVLDGQQVLELERGDEVVLGLSRTRIKVYENPARPFLRALQAKLGWQGSKKRSL